MSLSNQLRQLNRQAAEFRQNLFGTDDEGVAVQVEYDRGEKTVPGYYSPIKQEQKTQDAGAWAVYDTVVRVPKATAATFTPAMNKQIKLLETIGTETKEIQLTIKAIGGTHVSSVEWVLGCIALN